MMRTSELTGAALDWAVAKCEGVRLQYDSREGLIINNTLGWIPYRPSLAWQQGGPIIEREKIAVWFNTEYACWCSASLEWMDTDVDSDAFLEMPDAFRGPTPLIAAMRCYVASKLGDEVEIPEELTA